MKGGLGIWLRPVFDPSIRNLPIPWGCLHRAGAKAWSDGVLGLGQPLCPIPQEPLEAVGCWCRTQVGGGS